MSSIGYKLFEQRISDGKIFPLFIGKQQETLMNTWLHAEFIPTKGFAARGGWHIGTEVPDAPWLKNREGKYGSGRGKQFRRVWCECLYNENHDYTDFVQSLPKKCITDGVPEDGYYFFREANGHTWVITSDILITRILSEEERQKIMSEKNYDEAEAFKPYKETMEKRFKTLADKKNKE